MKQTLILCIAILLSHVATFAQKGSVANSDLPTITGVTLSKVSVPGVAAGVDNIVSDPDEAGVIYAVSYRMNSIFKYTIDETQKHFALVWSYKIHETCEFFCSKIEIFESNNKKMIAVLLGRNFLILSAQNGVENYSSIFVEKQKSFEKAPTPPCSTFSVVDYDGDGDSDIVAFGFYKGFKSWAYQNVGSQFVLTTTINNDFLPKVFGFDDSTIFSVGEKEYIARLVGVGEYRGIYVYSLPDLSEVYSEKTSKTETVYNSITAQENGFSYTGSCKGVGIIGMRKFSKNFGINKYSKKEFPMEPYSSLEYLGHTFVLGKNSMLYIDGNSGQLLPNGIIGLAQHGIIPFGKGVLVHTGSEKMFLVSAVVNDK